MGNMRNEINAIPESEGATVVRNLLVFLAETGSAAFSKFPNSVKWQYIPINKRSFQSITESQGRNIFETEFGIKFGFPGASLVKSLFGWASRQPLREEDSGEKFVGVNNNEQSEIEISEKQGKIFAKVSLAKGEVVYAFLSEIPEGDMKVNIFSRIQNKQGAVLQCQIIDCKYSFNVR